MEGRDTRYYPKVLLSDKQAITVHQLQPIASQTVKPKESRPQPAPTIITDDAWKDLPNQDPSNQHSIAPDPTPIPTVTSTPVATTINTDTKEPPF